ncbi:MAG: hypothetical protein KDB58_06760 [Solirubrobacterales bacterium]|nr:hypothetical protein [Solirubrobacterales bacterium]MCB8971173.1 hypothetical protein [Thermoleophilales bacterium]MCO5325972.1 PfkB family carbohydrate kinase [Solirubrobacterales bacterium]
MICAAANPAEDTTLVVDRLSPGAIHRPSELVRLPGGKAVNVARAAAVLGATARVVALLPVEGGEAFRSGLEREGIAVSSTAAAGSLRRCTSIYDAAAGNLTELYEPGGDPGGDAWDRFAALVTNGAWPSREPIVIAGSLPPGVPPTTFAELVAELIAGGAEVVIDTSGPALAALRGQAPALVKVNEHEAAELLGADASVSGVALSDGVSAAFGDATAIVTRGERGAVLSAPGEAFEVSLNAPGSFPVGSGDAFLAGLLSARERGRGLDEQLRIAVAAGAANAAMLGAGRLDPEAVANLSSRAVVAAVGAPGQ